AFGHEPIDVEGDMRLDLCAEVILVTPTPWPHISRLQRTENASNRGCQASPLLGFCDQLLPSSLCQFIEAGLAVVVRRAPFGANPSARFEALKGRIQRTVINEKCVLGLLLDRAGDALPVLWLK